MTDKAEATVPETVNQALETLLAAVGPARAQGIEQAVLSCLRSDAGAGDDWQGNLRTTLQSEPEKDAGKLSERYRDAFPAAYREMFPPRAAAADVPAIERLIETGAAAIEVHRPAAAGADTLHLRLYEPARPTALSELLPHLENMGLAVEEHFACHIHPAHAEAPICFQDFAMVSRDGATIDLDAVAFPFRETFARLLSGEVEDDGFNHLVLSAALDWRAVTMLRAYCRYLRQIACPFSEPYIERARVSTRSGS
jgi:glutamate dehydrogenase